MAELKRNHFVPKFMLKHWVTQGAKYEGVFYYDIRESRSYFANANGSRPFPFAIVEDLYIPIIEGERATALERWFSGLEGALASFTKQASTKSEHIALKTPADQTKIVMALFGLECRSRYQIEMFRKAVLSNPTLKAVISNAPDRNEHRLVLENIIHYVTEHTHRMGPPDLNILHTKGSFVCSDRPVFNDHRLGQRFVVLTNKCVASIEPSPVGQFRYRHVDIDSGFEDELNNKITMNARDWLIADSQAQLDRYAAIVGSEEWHNYVASETVEIEPVQAMTSSWSIPGDAARPHRR